MTRDEADARLRQLAQALRTRPLTAAERALLANLCGALAGRGTAAEKGARALALIGFAAPAHRPAGSGLSDEAALDGFLALARGQTWRAAASFAECSVRTLQRAKVARPALWQEALAVHAARIAGAKSLQRHLRRLEKVRQ